jgi:hypothetical protein
MLGKFVAVKGSTVTGYVVSVDNGILVRDGAGNEIATTTDAITEL